MCDYGYNAEKKMEADSSALTAVNTEKHLRALWMDYAKKFKEMEMGQQKAIEDLLKSIDDSNVALEAQLMNLTDLQIQYETLEEELQNETSAAQTTRNKFREIQSLVKLINRHCAMQKELSDTFDGMRPGVYERLHAVENLLEDSRRKMTHDEQSHLFTVSHLKKELNTHMERKESLKTRTMNIESNVKSTVGTLTSKMEGMRREIDHIKAQYLNIGGEIEQYQEKNQQKGHQLLGIKENMEAHRQAYSSEIDSAKAMILEQGDSITEKSEDRRSLQAALAAQEDLTKQTGGENSQLQEKLLTLEDENAKNNADLAEVTQGVHILKIEHDNLEADMDSLMRELDSKNEAVEKGGKELDNKNDEVKTLKENFSAKYWKGIENHNTWEQEKRELLANIDRLRKESDLKADLLKEIGAQRAHLQSISQLEEVCNEGRESAVADLYAVIGAARREKHAKSNALKDLKRKFKVASAERIKLQKNNFKFTSNIEAAQSELSAVEDRQNITVENEERVNKNEEHYLKELDMIQQQEACLREALKRLESELNNKSKLWAADEAATLEGIGQRQREAAARGERSKATEHHVKSKLAKAESEREQIRQENETEIAELQKHIKEREYLLANNENIMPALMRDLKKSIDIRTNIELNNVNYRKQVELLNYKITTQQDINSAAYSEKLLAAKEAVDKDSLDSAAVRSHDSNSKADESWSAPAAPAAAAASRDVPTAAGSMRQPPFTQRMQRFDSNKDKPDSDLDFDNFDYNNYL